MISIFIKFVGSNKSITLNMDTDCNVRELYHRLWEKLKHREGKLIYAGRFLEHPNKLLFDLGIKDCSTLFYVNCEGIQDIIDGEYKDVNSRKECIICFEIPKNGERMELYPCYHNRFCIKCSGKLISKKCPICRQNVQTIYKAQHQYA